MILEFDLGMWDDCYAEKECMADVARDTEACVLLSISCLPRKSTSSKCARIKSAPVMGWWTSAMVNTHVYICEPMLRERMRRPYSSIVDPWEVAKGWLRSPWWKALADTGITLTPTHVSFRNLRLEPDRRHRWALIMSVGHQGVQWRSALEFSWSMVKEFWNYMDVCTL